MDSKYFFVEADGDTLADLLDVLKEIQGRRFAGGVRIQSMTIEKNPAGRLEVSGTVEL